MAKDKDEYGFAGDLVPSGTWKGFGRAGYLLMAVLALIYGVCAFQYGIFNLLGPHGPFKGTDMAIATNWTRWNDLVFTPFVSLDYFEGKGSTTQAQTERYGRNWYFMSPHQLAGGTMILCSIVLMNPHLRYGRYAKWHRIAGDIYSVAHVFSLYGSLGFLTKHTFQGMVPKTYPENFEASISHGGVYGGSLFTMILWFYWLAGALSLTLGVYHIMRGEVQRHRSWMSVNYGTTMGAAFLRLNWAWLLYFFPEYRMDEINNTATILFICTMLWIAAGHSSLAHRKEYHFRGFSNHAVTLTLWVFGFGSACLVANQARLSWPSVSAQAGFDHTNWSHLTASTIHVAAWSVGLIAGGVLIPRLIHSGTRSQSGYLGWTYVAAGVIMFLSTTSLLGPPVSFSSFLWTGADQGHFNKLLVRCLWELRAGSVLVKTVIFGLAMRVHDHARIVEWSLHSYGEMASYSLTLVGVWATRSLFPTDEDCFAHAAVASALIGPLVGYIAAIYVMKPEPESVAAVRNGLFSEFRARKGSTGTKGD